MLSGVVLCRRVRVVCLDVCIHNTLVCVWCDAYPISDTPRARVEQPPWHPSANVRKTSQSDINGAPNVPVAAVL